MAQNEVKLVFKITDDGTISVLDQAGKKLGQVGETAKKASKEASDGFSGLQRSIITLNQGLDQALKRAAVSGVSVWRSSRCAFGPVLVTEAGGWPVMPGLNPVKARVALMLQLMA